MVDFHLCLQGSNILTTSRLIYYWVTLQLRKIRLTWDSKLCVSHLDLPIPPHDSIKTRSINQIYYFEQTNTQLFLGGWLNFDEQLFPHKIF